MSLEECYRIVEIATGKSIDEIMSMPLNDSIVLVNGSHVLGSPRDLMNKNCRIIDELLSRQAKEMYGSQEEVNNNFYRRILNGVFN